MSRLCSFTPQQTAQPVSSATSSAQFHAGARPSPASKRRSTTIVAASATCTLIEERSLPAWSHLSKQIEGLSSDQESTTSPVRITNESCQLVGLQPRVVDGMRIEVLPHPGQVMADQMFPPAAAQYFSNKLQVAVNPGFQYQSKQDIQLLPDNNTSHVSQQGFQHHEQIILEESSNGSYSQTEQASSQEAPALADDVKPRSRKQARKQSAKPRKNKQKLDSEEVAPTSSQQQTLLTTWNLDNPSNASVPDSEHVSKAATKFKKTEPLSLQNPPENPGNVQDFQVSWTGPSLPVACTRNNTEQHTTTSRQHTNDTDYIQSTKGTVRVLDTDKTSVLRNTMVRSKPRKQTLAQKQMPSGSAGQPVKFLVISREEQCKLTLACQHTMALEKVMIHMKRPLGHRPSYAQTAAVLGMTPDDLVSRLVAGKEAKQRLLLVCKGIIYKEAHREYRNLFKHGKAHMISVLDLMEEGKKGVLHAINKFDPSANCKFTTYAVPWIKQAIRRCIHKECALIRMSGTLIDDSAMLYRKKHQLQIASGTEPSIAELAQAMRWSEKRVQSALEAYQAAPKLNSILSLDMADKEDGDASMASSFSADSLVSRDGLATSSMGQTELNSENMFKTEDLEAAITQALEVLAQGSPKLANRGRTVLERFLGLHVDSDGERKGIQYREATSLRAIARELGVTTVQAQYLRDKGLAILREQSGDILEALFEEDNQHSLEVTTRSTPGAYKKH